MLLKVEGVESCNIDFGNKTAVCTVAEDVDAQALAAAVKGRFSATVQQ
ncbi:MAG: hypothetical protein ACE5JG_01895 [Planctomycetota bacterium]